MKFTSLNDLKKALGLNLLLTRTPSKPRLCPAEKSRLALGLNGQTGEDLIQELIIAYKKGHVTDVYQILLNVNVDAYSFYPLQGEAWGITMRSTELSALTDQAERMVRAIVCMAQDRTE